MIETKSHSRRFCIFKRRLVNQVTEDPALHRLAYLPEATQRTEGAKKLSILLPMCPLDLK